MALEKCLSSKTFSEALSLRKTSSSNEIWMKVEKHIEVEEIAREKGSRETRNRDRENKDQICVLKM